MVTGVYQDFYGGGFSVTGLPKIARRYLDETLIFSNHISEIIQAWRRASHPKSPIFRNSISGNRDRLPGAAKRPRPRPPAPPEMASLTPARRRTETGLRHLHAHYPRERTEPRAADEPRTPDVPPAQCAPRVRTHAPAIGWANPAPLNDDVNLPGFPVDLGPCAPWGPTCPHTPTTDWPGQLATCHPTAARELSTPAPDRSV